MCTVNDKNKTYCRHLTKYLNVTKLLEMTVIFTIQRKIKKEEEKKKKSLISRSWNKCQTGACIVHMEFCFETMSVTVSKLLQP